MAIEQHRVHVSLLTPPLLFGVERRLFFVVAGGAVPFLTFTDLSLGSLAALTLYALLAWAAAKRLTALDSDFLNLALQGMRYKDNYEPLPHPAVRGVSRPRRTR